MSSIAVIQHQKIGGKEIVPQEQELSDDSMRSGQMNISSFETGVRLIDVVELHVSFNQFNGKIHVLTHEKGRNAQMSVSTRPQENVDLEAGVEDEKLCEKVDFPQGDTTVIIQSVKAVYIDVADPVTAKSSSIPLQVKGDGEEVLLNANFEDEIVWFDMQSAKGITPEQQAQAAEMLAEGKADVSLDPDTAHPRLILSEDRKSVRQGEETQAMPNNPERFDSYCAVLGREGFTTGSLFWEVLVGSEGEWWVGVARKSVKRKGWLNFSPEEGIWAVEKWEGNYLAARKGFKLPLTLRGEPKRIRVCLNYDGGQVAFFLTLDRKQPPHM
uniref:Uncharacterized protein n=1 Tax=Sphaerodactylus townsendi TaxID=933632 RepID=A0ACB8EFL0_9SAUR